MPSGGTAFLALDRNSDGKISDGAELFGVKSGNGFVDLAKFDDDGDSVFEKLQLFTRDAQGNDLVFSLRDKGVAAIGLKNIQTIMNLAEQNKLKGMLRRTGLILRADESVSTVQHVDLKV